MTGAMMLVIALVLVACDPPCPTEAARKAALAYEQCLLVQQRGDGGLWCGQSAYNTFCKAGQ